MNEGVIVKFNADKGWGFIRSNNFESDLFFHISDFNDTATIQVGQRVEFMPKQSAKGLAVESISVIATPSSPYQRFTFWLIGLTLVIWAISYVAFSNINFIGHYLIGINAAAFLLFGYDKAIAGTDKDRIPERILHISSLAGGWFGSMAAMMVFRHKISKGAFLIRHWTILAIYGASYFAFSNLTQ